MEPERVNQDSVLDAKHLIPPRLLSVNRILIILTGVVIFLVLLYTPSLYSFTAVMTVFFVTIILAAISKVIENFNHSSYHKDLARRTRQVNAEGVAIQEQVAASYDELEAIGREQLDRENQNSRE